MKVFITIYDKCSFLFAIILLFENKKAIKQTYIKKKKEHFYLKLHHKTNIIYIYILIILNNEDKYIFI